MSRLTQRGPGGSLRSGSVRRAPVCQRGHAGRCAEEAAPQEKAPPLSGGRCWMSSQDLLLGLVTAL